MVPRSRFHGVDGSVPPALDLESGLRAGVVEVKRV
jgi:hypothetical protein